MRVRWCSSAVRGFRSGMGRISPTSRSWWSTSTKRTESRPMKSNTRHFTAMNRIEAAGDHNSTRRSVCWSEAIGWDLRRCVELSSSGSQDLQRLPFGSMRRYSPCRGPKEGRASLQRTSTTGLSKPEKRISASMPPQNCPCQRGTTGQASCTCTDASCPTRAERTSSSLRPISGVHT